LPKDHGRIWKFAPPESCLRELSKLTPPGSFLTAFRLPRPTVKKPVRTDKSFDHKACRHHRAGQQGFVPERPQISIGVQQIPVLIPAAGRIRMTYMKKNNLTNAIIMTDI
jgi:hypothetical protein